MRTSAPPLAGVFRGDMQFALLGELAADTGHGLSITQLAERTGAHYSAVHREVERLLKLGVVREQRAGRTRMIRLADDAPWLYPLRQLLLVTYGPLPLVREALDKLPYVVHAEIFGSWARRFAGEPGPAPRDVDVLVVFDPDHSAFPEQDTLELLTTISEVNGRVGNANVQATLIPVDEWAERSSSLLDRIADEPTVGITGDAYGKVRHADAS